MSNRAKNPSFAQYAGEKAGAVIAGAIVVVFAVGVILIVAGLRG